MTEYAVLWLIVFLFIVVGAFISVLFFRRRNWRYRRHRNLDSLLFRWQQEIAIPGSSSQAEPYNSEKTCGQLTTSYPHYYWWHIFIPYSPLLVPSPLLFCKSVAYFCALCWKLLIIRFGVKPKMANDCGRDFDRDRDRPRVPFSMPLYGNDRFHLCRITLASFEEIPLAYN